MADEQRVQAIDKDGSYEHVPKPVAVAGGDRRTPRDGVDGSHIGQLAAIAHGDREAFVRFYRSTHDRVFGLALRIVRARVVAERVTEEVYLQVWESAGQFDRRANTPIGWLVALTHRRAVDRARGESRSRTGAIPSPVRLSGPACGTAAAEHRAGAIMRRLEALTAAQRETLTLTYYSGWTYSEVAEQLGISSTDIVIRLRDSIERLGRIPTVS
ncbi:sigma-70 family RNA polymerase sigma factor [Nocardia sp. NBC_01503]|uniref:sigma-70 family RNA polymerase sigma factor n=1 Tax=Nocardia sp. NBC_01503 TaxID=2975997 RepID=UPI002E7C3DC8|nr:sigma-70 family RNA polymerase sigma factor [Nocardia sp. NBC_01503]WTL30623.1 sigma-70 family RNA polymerase sigma factor [Nocardia sp. NBC_01503]